MPDPRRDWRTAYELNGVVAAAEIRARLRELQLERLEAETAGLVQCDAYMADLAAEMAEQQEALVDAMLVEVIALRTELSHRQFG